MNREIKFRAWEKPGIVASSETGTTDFKGKMHLIEPTKENHRDSFLIYCFGRLDEYEIMQYTGLKDKNSKEIYEGDVVVYPDTYSDYVDVGVGEMKVAETTENSLAEVIFQEGTFGLVCPKRSETLRQGFKSFWWITNEYGFELSELEVVGNIYENPDYIN